MSRPVKLLLFVVLAGLAAGGGAMAVLIQHGVSALDEPTAMEAWMARTTRRLATPRGGRDAANPVAATGEVLSRARAHFADHCASCHGNDGRGNTPIGRNLYPKAPDMILPDTQSLSDGELFYIIENGVRLTGMPAWGTTGTHDATESWELVHFIRHLPKITPQELAEMEDLNPKSRKQLAEEEETRRFLSGGGEAPAPPSEHKH